MIKIQNEKGETVFKVEDDATRPVPVIVDEEEKEEGLEEEEEKE
jgi:hypothetical protein